MSGSVGGVDAAIPLSAGRIGQTGGNSLASDPAKFIDTMKGINDLRLFPGRQELQQQEIQQRGNQLQLFPGQQQQQQLELQRGALTNELAQQQLRDYKNKQVSAGLIPFFMKDNPTLSDATSALGQLKAAGNDVDGITEGIKTSGATGGQALTDAMRTQVVRAFPDSGLPKIEYQQLGNVLQPVNTNPIAGPLGPMGQALPMNLSPEQRLEAQTPQRGPNVDAGQFNYPSTLGPKLLPNGQPNPNANQQQIAGGAPGEAIPIVPSISDLATPVQYTGSDGKVVNTTKGQYAEDAGIDPAALGVVKPGQMMPPLPSGRTPGGGAAGGSRGQQPTQPSGRGPFSPMPAAERKDMSGPAPGTVEPAQASGKQFAEAQTAAGGFTNRVLPLRQALDKLSDTDTGPGSETLNHFRSLLVSMSNQGLLPKAITPNAVSQANFDELRKYMANYITNMPFAGGSDARMAEAISGNPNVSMSTLANRDLAKVLIGLERFRQAQYLGFSQAAKNGEFGDAARANPNLAAQNYGDWAAKFNTQYDPRAFAVDLMGGPQSPEVRKLYNSLGDKQQQRFVSSLKFASQVPGLMQ